MGNKKRNNKQSGTQTAPRKNGGDKNSKWLSALRIFGDTVAHIVDRMGWAGTFFVLAFFFVQYNGSAEQKRKIVDKFVLGENGHDIYSFIVLILLGILIFFAQNYYWKKRISVLNVEMERLSKWKSDHQQNAISSGLHHTEGENL